MSLWRGALDREPVLTSAARAWNDRHVGTKGLHGEARLAKLRAYAKRLKGLAPASQDEPRAWAFAILSRLANGETLPQLAETMARDAAGIRTEEV